MKTLELAQLDGNKPYVNTDDFGVKVNLLYFEKDGLALRTRYSNNKDTFFITFLLDLADKKNEEFYDYLRRRLVQGYTYFITQADNKLESIQGLYNEKRIEDRENAERLIDSYKYAIELLTKEEVER